MTTLTGTRRWFAVCTLYLLIFCDHLLTTVVIIFLATLILKADSPLVAHMTSLGTRHILYAVLIGASPALQILIEPFIGELSDLFGRRRIILFTTSMGLVGVGLAIVGIYASSLVLVMIGRALGGISSSNLSLSAAGITDLTVSQNRGRYMAIISMLEGVAWVLGPAIGSFLANPELVPWFGPAIPFWLLFSLFSCALFLLIFVVGEMHPPLENARFSLRQMWANYRETFRTPGVFNVFMTFTATVIGQLLFVYFLTLYLLERYMLMETQIANIFLYFAAWRFAGGVVTNQLFSWFSARNLAIIPMWLLGAASASLIWFEDPVNLWWIIPIAAIAQAAVTACFYTLFANRVGEGMRGKIFAAWLTAESAAYLSVPFVLAPLATLWIELPNLVGAALIFAAAAWFMLTIRRRKTI